MSDLLYNKVMSKPVRTVSQPCGRVLLKKKISNRHRDRSGVKVQNLVNIIRDQQVREKSRSPPVLTKGFQNINSHRAYVNMVLQTPKTSTLTEMSFKSRHQSLA